jgi:sugar phosphate isomerase/epimerase
MKFGYSTNAFVKFSIWEATDQIAALGFGGIEIMADRPHLYPPDFSPEKTAALKASIARAKLQITNLNSFTLFAVGDTYLPSWIEPSQHLPQRGLFFFLFRIGEGDSPGGGAQGENPGGARARSPAGEQPPV